MLKCRKNELKERIKAINVDGRGLDKEQKLYLCKFQLNINEILTNLPGKINK